MSHILTASERLTSRSYLRAAKRQGHRDLPAFAATTAVIAGIAVLITVVAHVSAIVAIVSFAELFAAAALIEATRLVKTVVAWYDHIHDLFGW